MKRIPSFSNRPGFPRGLRVLMLDADVGAREEAESQLCQCGYAPITCSSIPDVLVHLASGPPSDDSQGVRLSWDLLLADISFISPLVQDSPSLLSAAKSLPLILTHQGSPSIHCDLIMTGMKQGAVDILEKPLNPDKLKNIWQHVVRRQMMSLKSNPSSSPLSRKATKANGQPLRPTGSDQPSSDGCPASSNECPASKTLFLHHPGSGSNTSSSDRDKPSSDPRPYVHSSVMDMMMEMDLDTSSFLDAFDRDGMDLPLSDLFLEGSDLLGPSLEGTGGSKSNGGMSDLHVHISLNNSNPGSGPTPNPAALVPAAPAPPPAPTPAPQSTEAAGSGSVVVGYSCGQLPPLPPSSSGMVCVWGIPTNPLKIVPKSPLTPPNPNMMMIGMGMPPPPLPLSFPPPPPGMGGMGGRPLTPPPWMMGMGMGMPPFPLPPPPPGFMMPFPPLGGLPPFPTNMRPGTPSLPPFPMMGMMGMPSLPPQMAAGPQMSLPPAPAPQHQLQAQAVMQMPEPQVASTQPLPQLRSSAQFVEASPLPSGLDPQANAGCASNRSEYLEDSALLDLASPALLSSDGTPLLGLQKTGSFLDLISDSLASGGQWQSINQLG